MLSTVVEAGDGCLAAIVAAPRYAPPSVATLVGFDTQRGAYGTRPFNIQTDTFPPAKPRLRTLEHNPDLVRWCPTSSQHTRNIDCTL